VLVPERYFKYSLLFVGRAKSLPLSGAPERLAGDKHSSLFGLFASDEEKSVLTSTPGRPLPVGCLLRRPEILNRKKD
jgi:hypothetical protein